MANMIVTDVTNMLITNVTNLKDSLDVNKELATGGDDFSKVMNDATQKLGTSGDADEQPAATSTAVDKSATRDIKSEIKAQNDNKSSDEGDAAVGDEQIAEKCVQLSQKLAAKIKDTFGLSDEEIEEAMLNMGLGLQDLLDPAKLSELMMNLTGAEDSISLITDADAYLDFKSVVDFAVTEIEGLKSELTITDDKLNEVLDNTELFQTVLDEMPKDLELSDLQIPVEQTLTENVQPLIDAATIQQPEIQASLQEVQTAGNKITVEVNKTDEVVSTPQPVEDAKTDEKTDADLGETESFQEVIGKAVVDNKEPMKDTARIARFDRSEGEENPIAAREGSGFTQTITTNTQVNTVGDIVETVTTYTNVDANEIASQVAQSIRVNISAESASLEMQLHPASLGTVNMQVSSANGVVTANIIVQSEAVKAALESQLITLQETFEAQGQRVEAVEVTVAGYNMNQNPNRDNGQNESERKEKESFRISGGRRRINLSDFAEGDDVTELSEEERIAKDMMERNGNSVDYMA